MIGGSTIAWERPGCTGPISFWDGLNKGDVRAYRLFEPAAITATPSPTTVPTYSPTPVFTPTVSPTILPSVTPEPSVTATVEITPVDERVFQDIPPDHWAADYVEFLFNEGYTDGCYDDGEVRNYCGQDEMTRAEMSVFLTRALNPDVPSFLPPEPTAEEIPFKDPEYWQGAYPVSMAALIPNWFNKWTLYTYEEGYYRGCSAEEVYFCPLDGNSRAALAVLVERLLHGVDYVPERAGEQLYGDVPLWDEIGERYWASDWVAVAHRDGLIQACGTDLERMLFFPEETADRYTAACMFYHAIQAVADGLSETSGLEAP
jgi:hypothetical protein